MIKWIVESDIFNEKCFNDMIKHFKDKNIAYDIVRIIPFVHEIDGKIPIVNSDDQVVICGSIGIQKLANTYNWNPGVWTNSKFTEHEARVGIGSLYLNSDMLVIPLNCVDFAVKDKKWNEFFIKPNTDTKEFAGQTIIADNFNKWIDQMISSGYVDKSILDIDVCISSVKKITTEFRCIVVNGKCIEASIYRQHGIFKPKRVTDYPELFEFVEKLNEKYSPHDVYVVDIANFENDFKVIEYNTFNSAALYECDVGNIIDSINNFLMKE